MNETQPDKYCSKGHLIPDNRQLLEDWYKSAREAEAAKLPLPRKPNIKGPQLICRVCAEANSIGLTQRQRVDKHHEDQLLIDAPMMFIK